ncbi:acyl carrier protein [Chryseobacterium balustinum]|uniref:acyl carrier protein n=1 Tax=Chryseobacterium balustinum TaxID=246 RepID=UPI003CEB7EA3
MKKNEFIVGLGEELELSQTLTEDTDLKSLEEWDSMASMLLIGYVSNETGVTITSDDLKEITTVNSLLEKIGMDKFE